MDVDHALSRAKALLVLRHPFIASILCGMPLHLDNTLNPPTLATDGKGIYVHPEWVAKHSPSELQFALAHEVMHCVLQHVFPARMGTRDPKLWNVSGDVVINYLLDQDSIGTRPPNCIWEPDLYKRGEGVTERIYALLQKQSGGGGSGGPGVPQPWDMCQPMPGDEAAQAEAEATWKVKVAQAAAAAKACGKLSEPFKRFVDDLMKPQVRWQDQLRDFFYKRARVERSFARPNRRFAAQGLYLPGLSGYKMGPVVVGVDLSGSVTPDELRCFVTELKAIREDCNPERIHVLYFDSKVSHTETFEEGEPMDLNPKGGGGTAFSPIFRYVEAHGLMPEAAVVLTDLHCNDFGPPPGYPVMWASTGADQAPWGQVISLNGDTHA
jgi:predicted metal-dependent peptidase